MKARLTALTSSSGVVAKTKYIKQVVQSPWYRKHIHDGLLAANK
jgi:hypothetical protein